MLAVALLALFAFGNSIGGSFLFDDAGMLQDPYVTGPGFALEIFRLEQTRPLTYLTFHWNHLAGGENPQGYHAVNIGLHAVNAALVLAISRYALSPALALLAACLFAVHPLQSEAVSYVFQRASLLAALFALLSFWLYLKQRRAWSVAAFALSLLAKEETMALPAMLLLHEFLVRGRRSIRPGYYAAMFTLTGLAAARLFYALHQATEPTMGFRMKNAEALSYLLTQARVIWQYLALFVWPAGLNLDHDVALSRSLISPPATLPALACLAAGIGVLGWLAWRGRWPASIWLLGFFILLSPSSSVVPAADVMFEHRTYFPLACLVIATAALWGRMPSRLLAGTAVAVLMTLTAASIARNRTWRDAESLWTDTLAKSPRKVRPYLNLAWVYSRTQPARSRQLLEKAVSLEPGNADAQSLLGVIMMVQSEPGPALRQFERALALRGETAPELTNIGTARSRLGQMEAAVADFRRALTLDPCFPAARLSLMSALAAMANREEAWRIGEIPQGCRYTPADAQNLENVRRQTSQSGAP
jgi:Tfp pilus assembly protein PilF